MCVYFAISVGSKQEMCLIHVHYVSEHSASFSEWHHEGILQNMQISFHYKQFNSSSLIPLYYKVYNEQIVRWFYEVHVNCWQHLQTYSKGSYNSEKRYLPFSVDLWWPLYEVKGLSSPYIVKSISILVSKCGKFYRKH